MNTNTSPLNYSVPMLVARDRDTGRILTYEEATRAADNPGIYKWVEFLSR